MDSIDIIDPTFSLSAPNFNESIDNGAGDYTTYIYIGIASLVIVVGLFLYTTAKSRENNSTEEDCPGGFCTMNQANSSTS